MNRVTTELDQIKEFKRFMDSMTIELEKKLEVAGHPSTVTVHSNRKIEKPCIRVIENKSKKVCEFDLTAITAHWMNNPSVADFNINNLFKIVLLELENDTSSRFDVIDNWGYAKNHISAVLVNTEANPWTEMYVTDRILDLSMVFMISHDRGSTKITKEQLQKWGITKQDVIDAYQITKPSTTKIYSLQDIFVNKRYVNIFPSDVCFNGSLEGTQAAYTLTTESRENGSVLLYDLDILERISKGVDFYIIPCSVHELLLISPISFYSVSDMKKMVKEVNETDVSKEERLSDNVYFYDSAEHKITIC